MAVPMLRYWLIVLCALVFTPEQARSQQSRWVEVGRSDYFTTYVDTQTLRRNEAKVTAWVRYVFFAPIKADTQPYKPFVQLPFLPLDTTYSSAMTLEVYNCADLTTATLEMIRYVNADTSGGVVESFSFLPESRATPRAVKPNSTGESVLGYVCSKR